MSDAVSTQRRGRPRDPRLDSSPPADDDEPVGNAPSAAPLREPSSGRVAALEGALAHLKRERAAEADDLAAMLVRIAEAERARSAAEQRASALSETLRIAHEKIEEVATREPPPPTEHPRFAVLIAELEQEKTHAAELEAQVADARAMARGAQARLEEAAAQREAQRARAEQLEAALTSMRCEHTAALDAMRSERTAAQAVWQREHADAVRTLMMEHEREREVRRSEHLAAVEELRHEHEEALSALQASFEASSRAREAKHVQELDDLREAHEDAKRLAAVALEEERSTAARARQHAAALDVALLAARESLARTGTVLEEMDRREEMAAALRKRSLEQARQALTVRGSVPAPSRDPHRGATVRPGILSAFGAPPPPARQAVAGTASGRPTVEVVEVAEVDDFEIDLAE